MKAYMYCAALHCENCGEKIRKELSAQGKAPVNPADEYTFDSDEFPKGPYADGGGEADMPQHCDSCGVFLENPLTNYGYDYIRQAKKELPADRFPEEWLDYYSEAWTGLGTQAGR